MQRVVAVAPHKHVIAAQTFEEIVVLSAGMGVVASRADPVFPDPNVSGNIADERVVGHAGIARRRRKRARKRALQGDGRIGGAVTVAVDVEGGRTGCGGCGDGTISKALARDPNGIVGREIGDRVAVQFARGSGEYVVTVVAGERIVAGEPFDEIVAGIAGKGICSR